MRSKHFGNGARRSGKPGGGGGGRAAKIAAALGAVALAAGVVWGAATGYSALKRMTEEPCVVTNAAEQVCVSFGGAPDGRNVKRGVMTGFFGLTNGANLARIDYAGKRRKFLENPMFSVVKDLSVEWDQSGNRVNIEVTERIPVARIGTMSCDAEGVVMNVRADPSAPKLVLPGGRAPDPGERLEGRSAAALRLVTSAKTAAPELVLRHVGVGQDGMIVYFGAPGGNHEARFVWDGVDGPDRESGKELEARLKMLSLAIKSGLHGDCGYWNVFDAKRATFVEQ